MNSNKLLTIFLLTTALTFSYNSVLAKEDTAPALDAAADQYNKNKSNDKYKVVCRREAPIGSRIKKRVCRTVAMMDGEERMAKEVLDRLRTSVGRQS
jgi:hypothetical protein